MSSDSQNYYPAHGARDLLQKIQEGAPPSEDWRARALDAESRVRQLEEALRRVRHDYWDDSTIGTRTLQDIDATLATSTPPGPSKEEATVDRLTPAELLALPEYSSTVPTGTTIGKRWRRHQPSRRACGDNPTCGHWWTGEYFESGKESGVGIRWLKVEIIEPITSEGAR